MNKDFKWVNSWTLHSTTMTFSFSVGDRDWQGPPELIVGGWNDPRGPKVGIPYATTTTAGSFVVKWDSTGLWTI